MKIKKMQFCFDKDWIRILAENVSAAIERAQVFMEMDEANTFYKSILSICKDVESRLEPAFNGANLRIRKITFGKKPSIDCEDDRAIAIHISCDTSIIPTVEKVVLSSSIQNIEKLLEEFVLNGTRKKE